MYSQTDQSFVKTLFALKPHKSHIKEYLTAAYDINYLTQRNDYTTRKFNTWSKRKRHGILSV